MSSIPEQSVLWELHSGLPREGPGDNLSTRIAFALLDELPRVPRILDLGCGPGMQTLELARLCDGEITAVDLHQPYLDELARRSRAAGLAQRITPMKASMAALPFAPGSFDVIWSEGAIYNIGFGEGLALWRPLLADGGFVAVTDCCWLRPEPPKELRDFWRQYPGMMTVAATSEAIRRAGYAELRHFTLPQAAWWDDYYTPMQARIAALEVKYAANPAALAELAQARREIDLYRRCGGYYGYVFFVMRKAD